MKLVIDLERRTVSVDDLGRKTTHSLSSPEAFSAVSRAWLHCGWDTKHVYTFTWLGRPIIQLPEDLLRIQEVIYALKPDVILETGIAHGGSLIFTPASAGSWIVGESSGSTWHCGITTGGPSSSTSSPHITLVDGSPWTRPSSSRCVR
jgi:cephalosporin hydroxylase